MTQASTFDFVVLDATLTFKKHQEDKANGRAPDIDPEIMKQAIQTINSQ
jgi:hypothetical protein